MEGFERALARVFADPNMATDGLWLKGGAEPGIPIRLIRKAPDEVTSYGGARVWSDTLRADVMVSQMPNPAPGDPINIGPEAWEVQGEPARDRERLIWTLDLRPA
ncbi:hypothetical protein CG51_00750 [Haematobacter missouriensis]|uniref:Uncharacterized protein n=1 Tax=Haematobacter missouriensis TaxID=366616 RepID=A0A212AIS1_9RHOB|nr:hypothetical protein [Haematobacter missouriensis]KFI32641.1 hypothetical protein CG51_00750 [Haematobacter missouriensis]OWJ79161.1 hypothetical protein CDV53_02460 [Haematobacter missouriensis]OWJ81306.1 hypothetical protein CDV52_18780 [Haematobacter missouriensis]